MKIFKYEDFSLGGWVQIGHPSCAEIFADAGMNWVCVDLEHGVIGIETMTNIFRAAEAKNIHPVARIPINDPVWIHRVLDAGAKGIIIPMVKSREEAYNAIKECKFPPEGERSFGYSRANQYGQNFDNHIKEADKDISVIIQIEHRDAIRYLDEILTLGGIDATFIGPYDLSGSFGSPGDFENEAFKDAIKKYLDLSKKYNVPTGLHIVRPDKKNISKAIEDGYHLIALGTDAILLGDKTKEILECFEDGVEDQFD